MHIYRQHGVGHAARRGEARRGEARRGEARRGEARRGEARRGEARRGEGTKGGGSGAQLPKKFLGHALFVQGHALFLLRATPFFKIVCGPRP